jgi:hypothetical protein
MASLIDRYIELVASYKWSPLFVKWAFIAAISAVLERKCWVDEEALGLLYPNLYVLFVGPAGMGKSSSTDYVIDKFIRPLENGPILASTHQSPATLIDELDAANKAQPGAHQSSPLFAYAPEFDTWFKDIGGGELVDLLLNFWDTRRVGVEWVKNTKMHKRQAIKNPALTILGCTTPQALIEKRLAQTGSIGFISRIIIVSEPNGDDYGTFDFVKVDHSKLIQIQNEFARMRDINGEFRLGPGTEAVRREMLVRAKESMKEFSGDLMRTYMSRKAVQIRKVSMILSAMRNSRKIILPEDILEAEALINELEPTIQDAFGLQTNYQDPGLASKVRSKFKRGQFLSEENLYAQFFREGEALPKNSEVQGIIDGMIKAGELTRIIKDGKLIYVRNAT